MYQKYKYLLCISLLFAGCVKSNPRFLGIEVNQSSSSSNNPGNPGNSTYPGYSTCPLASDVNAYYKDTTNPLNIIKKEGWSVDSVSAYPENYVFKFKSAMSFENDQMKPKIYCKYASDLNNEDAPSVQFIRNEKVEIIKDRSEWGKVEYDTVGGNDYNCPALKDKGKIISEIDCRFTYSGDVSPKK